MKNLFTYHLGGNYEKVFQLFTLLDILLIIDIILFLM